MVKKHTKKNNVRSETLHPKPREAVPPEKQSDVPTTVGQCGLRPTLVDIPTGGKRGKQEAAGYAGLVTVLSNVE